MKKITRESKGMIVELPSRAFGGLYGPRSPDVFMIYNLPSRGATRLTGRLHQSGYKNTGVFNPLYHGDKDGQISSANWAELKACDWVGISAITRTRQPSITFAREIRRINPNALIIAGGPDPTFNPENYRCLVDFILSYECLDALPELLEETEKNSPDFTKLKRIHFQQDIPWMPFPTPPPEDFVSSEMLNRIAHPYYDAKTLEKVEVIGVETSLGCRGKCKFCSVYKMEGNELRFRSIPYVLEEIEYAHNHKKSVMFIDSDFSQNDQAVELLREMKKQGMDKISNSAEVSIQVTQNPELLDALWDANVRILYIGVESLNQATLSKMKKRFSARQNLEGLEELRRRKFWTHAMTVVGGDGDTPDSVREDVRVLSNLVISAQIFTPTTFPGTELELERRIAETQLDISPSLRDAQHVDFIPQNFTPAGLQRTLYDLYKTFYHPSSTLPRAARVPKEKILDALGFAAISPFLIRKLINNPESSQHLKYLEAIS
jgi:radical SAM superfamily enzyme YgiQ (UPF0313 family)